MGRGQNNKQQGIAMREVKKQTSTNLFLNAKNPIELSESLFDARSQIDNDFIEKAKELLSPEWQKKITSNNTETAEKVLYASFYYERYKIDPYRLQDHYRKAVNNISGPNRNRKSSLKLALDTLLEKESPAYTEKLSSKLLEAGLNEKDFSAEDLSKQTLQLIWSMKNSYSPKSIRKHFSAEKLNNKAIEAIVETFADFEYDQPEVFPN